MKPWANRGMATAIRRLQHFIILAASEDDFCDECVVCGGVGKKGTGSQKRGALYSLACGHGALACHTLRFDPSGGEVAPVLC